MNPVPTCAVPHKPFCSVITLVHAAIWSAWTCIRRGFLFDRADNTPSLKSDHSPTLAYQSGSYTVVSRGCIGHEALSGNCTCRAQLEGQLHVTREAESLLIVGPVFALFPSHSKDRSDHLMLHSYYSTRLARPFSETKTPLSRWGALAII
jgi:hypothetical protein